jgi:tetratricopeptide (TPR) repeat protein
VLAFNYGRLIVLADSASAAEALERAQQLQSEVDAQIPVDDLDLYLAFAEFRRAEGNRRASDDLRDALGVFATDAGPVASVELAAMWLELGSMDLLNERYRKAADSAEQAEAAILAAAPDDHRTLAIAVMTQGAALLLPSPRPQWKIADAHVEFQRARALFPPQQDIATFDPVLGQLMAWEMAARAAYRTQGRDEYAEHTHAPGATDDEMPNLFVVSGTNRKQCPETEWENRDPPEYPPGALQKGYIGAVVIGFNLQPDKMLSDVAILGEVPANRFSEAVLEAAVGWKVGKVPDGEPACMLNQFTSVTFVIED